MSPDHIALLQKMAVFGGISEESLCTILGGSELRTIPADAFFFREGDPGGSLFVIEDGDVVIERLWKDQKVELGRLGPGDCVGEMALLDFQPRSASVKALRDCAVIQIPTKALHALYKEDHDQYAMIMMNLGREVSRRLRKADDLLFQARQEGA